MGYFGPNEAAPGLFALPPLGAIAAILLAAAFPSIHHVVRHAIHAPHRRDPSAPPEDLSWRTRSALVKNVTLSIVLVASAIFMLTPKAEQIARATPLPTLVPLAIGCALLFVSIRGLVAGEIAPAFWRGFGPYEKTERPASYRASLVWNAALASTLLVTTPVGWLQGKLDHCEGRGQYRRGNDALDACNRIIGMRFLPAETRARAYGGRGQIRYRNGLHDAAVVDFTRAVQLDPDNAFLRSMRALSLLTVGDRTGAGRELAAAEALGLDRNQRAVMHANIHSYDNNYDLAIAELTKVLELDPKQPIVLMSRGWAYGMNNQYDLGKRDMVHAMKIAPGDPQLLRASSLFAIYYEDHAAALFYINQYLRLFPNDIEAIQDRSDVYWAMGKEEKSRRDDDRAWEIQDESDAADAARK